MTNVAIVGGSEETRLLLRGLVRLHHHRVVSEGGGPESLRELPHDGSELVVLVDADLEEEGWSLPLSKAFRDAPSRRAVLISPARSARIEQRAKELGFATVLRRPFAVHELVAAISGPPAAPTPAVPSESVPAERPSS